MEQKDMTKKTKANKKKDVFSTIIYLCIVLAVTVLFICFVAQRTTVSGDSMYPTLHNRDNLIVDKISYKFHDPERYDVIVFPYQYEDHTYFIKRIIGLPGETVQIDAGGNIYIDGEVLDEDYGYETIAYQGLAADPIVLSDDEYFVLGDNRNHSEDSRYPDVGLIHKDDIVGRAWVRIFPFKDFGLVKNIHEN